MSKKDGWGKRCRGCAYCAHANKKEMKCYPNSRDCAPEYNLEEDDFKRECNCDFFKEKERENGSC